MIRALFLTIMLLPAFVNGQSLNKAYVDGWVLKSDTSIKPQKITLYVVDGVPYDALKLDSVLNSITMQKLAGIDYLNTKEFPGAEVWNNYVVVLTTKRKEKRSWKAKELKEALSKYAATSLYTNHIDTGMHEPVLVVNDKQVFHSDCYKTLSQIKVGHIEYIHIANHAVPSEYYGQNAKNGLIQIWTYKQ